MTGRRCDAGTIISFFPNQGDQGMNNPTSEFASDRSTDTWYEYKRFSREVESREQGVETRGGNNKKSNHKRPRLDKY